MELGKTIIISGIITAIVAILGRRKLPKIIYSLFKFIYLSLRYGFDYVDYYNKANIIKFDILGLTLKRNKNIRFYIRTEDKWVEGKIIGLTSDNYLLVRNNKGDIMGYLKDHLQKGDLILASNINK